MRSDRRKIPSRPSDESFFPLLGGIVLASLLATILLVVLFR